MGRIRFCAAQVGFGGELIGPALLSVAISRGGAGAYVESAEPREKEIGREKEGGFRPCNCRAKVPAPGGRRECRSYTPLPDYRVLVHGNRHEQACGRRLTADRSGFEAASNDVRKMCPDACSRSGQTRSGVLCAASRAQNQSTGRRT